MADEAANNLINGWSESAKQVSTKAVGSQLALMSGLSLITLIAFSVLRPHDKRVYAPKVKYHQTVDPLNTNNPNNAGGAAAINSNSEDPYADNAPPPAVKNGFFSWFSPVLHTHEQAMLDQIGLDGVTFLRVLRLLRICFSVVSVAVAGILLPINIIYNRNNVNYYNFFSQLTIQNLSGNILWAHVAVTYSINIVICYFIWYHWKKMVLLRQSWFRSKGYRNKIYSRTLMVTYVPMEFRTDEGLVHLMGKLKVDGIKIGSQIDCTSIGRKLEDFPDLVEEHNEAVRHLEQTLVKYLKGGKVAAKRPQIKKGGFMGCGGQKSDAIDYYSKKVKFLRDKIDQKRADIDALIRRDRNARKQKREIKPHGENYGFVTFKTIAEAHRIARMHTGRLRELGGAELQLAPPPRDLIWKNVPMEPAQRTGRVFMGFVYLGIICFLNTAPLTAVSILANLASLSVYVGFLNRWKDAGSFGNWTFSIVSGVLPSVIMAIFGFLLPIFMRRLSKYQGATTRSRLDRAVMARYFAFMIISNFVIFSLLGVIWNAVAQIIAEAGEKKSFNEIMNGLTDLPNKIQQSYVQLSVYWLTAFPLRGFLIVFEIAQLIKLFMLSIQRLLFAKTPRDVKEYTKPPYFEYAVVLTNLLFSGAVALIYAPLAPLVCVGYTIVFWISSIVYKYQLLYVYVSRAESGGRLFNVATNRLMASTVFMDGLMLLTIGLNRRNYKDVIATAPAILIVLAFKIFMVRPLEVQFKFYTPTTQEAEAEWENSMSEKRTHHREMEKRFLHPALQSNELFTVMVHKKQESLAREVLSAYPWFNRSQGNKDTIAIKAVAEENLDYNPNKDRANNADWDTQSISSSRMLDGKSDIGYGGPSRSETGTPMDDKLQAYYEQGQMAQSSSDLGYPMQSLGMYQQGQEGGQYSPVGYNQSSGGPARKPSVREYNPRRMTGDDPIAVRPLLEEGNESQYHLPPSNPMSRQHSEYSPSDVSAAPPYPPSSFHSPPVGYTPPGMRRQDSQASSAGEGEDGHFRRPWDDGQRRFQ